MASKPMTQAELEAYTTQLIELFDTHDIELTPAQIPGTDQHILQVTLSWSYMDAKRAVDISALWNKAFRQKLASAQGEKVIVGFSTENPKELLASLTPAKANIHNIVNAYAPTPATPAAPASPSAPINNTIPPARPSIGEVFRNGLEEIFPPLKRRRIEKELEKQATAARAAAEEADRKAEKKRLENDAGTEAATRQEAIDARANALNMVQKAITETERLTQYTLLLEAQKTEVIQGLASHLPDLLNLRIGLNKTTLNKGTPQEITLRLPNEVFAPEVIAALQNVGELAKLVIGPVNGDLAVADMTPKNRKAFKAVLKQLQATEKDIGKALENFDNPVWSRLIRTLNAPEIDLSKIDSPDLKNDLSRLIEAHDLLSKETGAPIYTKENYDEATAEANKFLEKYISKTKHAANETLTKSTEFSKDLADRVLMAGDIYRRLHSACSTEGTLTAPGEKSYELLTILEGLDINDVKKIGPGVMAQILLSKGPEGKPLLVELAKAQGMNQQILEVSLTQWVPDPFLRLALLDNRDVKKHLKDDLAHENALADAKAKTTPPKAANTAGQIAWRTQTEDRIALYKDDPLNAAVGDNIMKNYGEYRAEKAARLAEKRQEEAAIKAAQAAAKQAADEAAALDKNAVAETKKHLSSNLSLLQAHFKTDTSGGDDEIQKIRTYLNSSNPSTKSSAERAIANLMIPKTLKKTLGIIINNDPAVIRAVLLAPETDIKSLVELCVSYDQKVTTQLNMERVTPLLVREIHDALMHGPEHEKNKMVMHRLLSPVPEKIRATILDEAFPKEAARRHALEEADKAKAAAEKTAEAKAARRKGFLGGMWHAAAGREIKL